MKHRYIVSTFLVSISAAGVGGFFAGANYTRIHPLKTTTTEASASSSATTTQSTTADGSAPPTSTDPATTSGNTYIVKKGQTLYSIGKEVGIEWPALAKANNLDEHSLLKEGQVITIPSKTEAQTIQAKEYDIPVNAEETQNVEAAQGYADAGTGQLAYRMVPTQVVQRSPLLTRFGFDNNDLYIEKSKDTEKGSAVVEVTHQSKLYSVYLKAFQTGKGDKTVWTPSKVLY